MGELLGLPEVAERLGVTHQRVWQLVRAGRLEAVQVGRTWVVDEDALDRFKRRREEEEQERGG